MKIGFIGLGNMGAPMALNLLKVGHALNVFDLSVEAVRTLDFTGLAQKNGTVVARTQNMHRSYRFR